VHWSARIALLSVAVNLVASLALVGPLGLRGVVLGTTLAYLVTGPLWIALTLRAVGVRAAEFARRAAAPALAAGALTAAGAACLRFLAPDALVGLVLAGACSFVAGCAIVYLLAPRGERGDLVRSLSRA
jgi:peptidoglycan biosynthesis protein MviN/MurJ (putative lipid II flippase)